MYFTDATQRPVSSSRTISNEADWHHDIFNITAFNSHLIFSTQQHPKLNYVAYFDKIIDEFSWQLVVIAIIKMPKELPGTPVTKNWHRKLLKQPLNRR